MRLPNVKILLCWPSRMQIYGFVENHTFLEQFVSGRGGTSTIFQSGGTSTIFQSGGTSTIFQSGGISTIFQSGGTSTIFQSGYQHNFPIWGYQHNFPIWGYQHIFSTLHGSLWLGKDKGSIMKRAESGGTIHLEINFSSKVYSKSLLKGSPLSCTSLE